MYYDLDEALKVKFKDGQLLLYSKQGDTAIIEVESKPGYDAKYLGLPSEDRSDSYFVNGLIKEDEVEPISIETHPEIFVKMGFSPQPKCKIKKGKI